MLPLALGWLCLTHGEQGLALTRYVTAVLSLRFRHFLYGWKEKKNQVIETSQQYGWD